MSMAIAFRIFGVTQRPNRATLIARYRVLALEHHPDRGGDTTVMAAINAAYAYLQ
jgi:curved DNA-binding protein CbpA